jgi:hypothetical protein
LICAATSDASARMSGVGVDVGFAPRMGLFCCCLGCCFCCFGMERACDAAPSAIKTITVKIETRFKRDSSKRFQTAPAARSLGCGPRRLIRN